jgi:putative ATP-dependent endonuclease of OLD family
VPLNWLTVLIGENNAGKSNFIEAMRIAIGIGARRIEKEDIYVDVEETDPPEDREAIIDLLLRPIDNQGETISKFPDNDYWLNLWGAGISENDTLGEFMAIRTRLYWNKEEMRYEIERKYLKDWQHDPEKIGQSKTKEIIRFDQIEPVSLYVLDTNRDVKNDLVKTGSIWHQMVSATKFDDSDSKDIEGKIEELNQIINSNKFIVEIKEGLKELSKTFNSGSDSVALTSIPSRTRDLMDNVGINFATNGAGSFPIERHSSGTRSVASVLIFKTYIERRMKLDNERKIHPVLAIEEPETHLHPQAEDSFYRIVKNFYGQKVISTHSPRVASLSGLRDLRYFYKTGSETNIVSMENDFLLEEDEHLVRRKVLKTHGDIFYSRAIVLYEGEETEDQVLPLFALEYWEEEYSSLGITMVNVNGQKYYPFLLLAKTFQIKWYIFSDGEPNTVAAVENAVNKIGTKIVSPNIVILPDGKSFEKYISSNEYKEVLKEMIVNVKSKNEYHKRALEAECEKWTLDDLINELKDNKTLYAPRIAPAILSVKDEELRFPAKIRELFEKISNDFGFKRRDIDHRS